MDTAISEILVWLCLGVDPIATQAWDALVRLGLRDKKRLLGDHCEGWRGEASQPSAYRRRLRDFFDTWRQRCVEYMVSRASLDRLPARRVSMASSPSVFTEPDTRPRFPVPPSAIDVLNFFVYMEEERLKIPVRQPVVRASDPRQPTVRPDIHTSSSVARIGYCRPTPSTRLDRDSTLMLPPITPASRFRAYELPPKLQSVALYSEEGESAPDPGITLSGLRAHNKMFVLSQSWAPD